VEVVVVEEINQGEVIMLEVHLLILTAEERVVAVLVELRLV
jgi:hypothetical protein